LYSVQDLRSILNNLITNAIIYRSSDRHPAITVRTERSFKGPCLIVKDNGRGIDLTAHGDKLFMRYQRFHNDVEGTGVGLWLIKEIIEKNGGQIFVESVVGQGTTFKVFF
jgi:signal transduction histidine kinase